MARVSSFVSPTVLVDRNIDESTYDNIKKLIEIKSSIVTNAENIQSIIDARQYADNASASADSANSSRISASYWGQTAQDSALSASTSEANALTSENKAYRWAEEIHGIEVESDKYSAKHYAIEAEGSANKAESLANNIDTISVDTVEDLGAVDTSLYKTVIVKDSGRGGIFIWSAEGTADGGITFAGSDGYWVRQYSGAVNVKWFGAKTDGSNNTPIYTNIINALDEGTTIEWTAETYVGDFISNKAFVLKGNGATIVPVTTFGIRFEGALGNYNALDVAPTHNDISLSGVSDLTEDAYVLLYSGNQRPSDNANINYEVLKIRPDGTVYDKVYSDQNGGTPVYAVITPLNGVKVDGFTIEAGTSAVYGVWIRYAINVQVSNIKMNGGSASTVTIRHSLNVTVHHIQRIKPSAIGSGQGYNISLNAVKYGKVYSVYDEACRHSYDQDSSYVMDISKVISIECQSSAIVIAHNSFGGYTTVKDCSISKCNSYAINASAQGLDNPSDGLFRELIIDNIRISNTKARNVYDFYVGVFLAIPLKNGSISNITIENITSTIFDYPADTYNTGYFAIRLYDVRENLAIKNLNLDMATHSVFIDNITNQSANIDIAFINVTYWANVVTIYNIASSNIGKVTVSNLDPYESSTVHGKAVINILEGTYRLYSLMVYGLKKIPFYAKLVKLPNNTVGCPSVSKIDTAGFVRRLSSLNYTPAGGTITQQEYLTRGEYGVWGGSSITLSATEPFERPITSGDRFSIFNYGSDTLTIPANSETVANTSDLLIEPNYLYEFQANSDGNKWLLARKIAGITLQ